MRIGLDLRWLEQAYALSPTTGGMGGAGGFSRNLWLGLARLFPDIELVALVSRKRDLPDPLLRLIRTAPKHIIYPFGLEGLIPAWYNRGKYRLLLHLIESELGIFANLNVLKLDVLHLLDYTVAPAPRGRNGCPVIGTIYDLYGWKAALQNHDIYGVIERYRFSKLIERCQVLVPISNFTRDDLERCFPKRSGPFPVVECGIEVEAFNRHDEMMTDDTIRERFGLSGSYFLHVGVLLDRKNPVGLIQAMAKVIRRGHSDISLVCAGPYQSFPTTKERVIELAREEGIETSVRIIGDVGLQDLAHLYRHALGLVFPSFGEGFGLPAIECLASGVPCVVSRCGALPEVVGDFGILVDPHSDEEVADGMLRLLDDSSYRAKIKEQGPRWAQRFSLETMAKKYMEIYQGLA